MTTETPTFQAPETSAVPTPKEPVKKKATGKVKTKNALRKSFPVQCVQVSPENIEQVAAWCAGTIMHDGDKEGHLSRDYIKVRVAYPLTPRQTQAYFSDWVLKSGKSFKVYTDSAFRKSFEIQDDNG